MGTAKDGVIRELMLARDLIQDAALDVGEELYSGAGVGLAKARYAIAQALSEIEQAALEEDSEMEPPRARIAFDHASGIISSGGRNKNRFPSR